KRTDARPFGGSVPSNSFASGRSVWSHSFASGPSVWSHSLVGWPVGFVTLTRRPARRVRHTHSQAGPAVSSNSPQAARPSASVRRVARAIRYDGRVTRPILECVPNVSEGRDRRVLDQLAESIRGVGGVTLADVHSDPDHHRSVFTILGSPDDVERAAVVLAEA